MPTASCCPTTLPRGLRPGSALGPDAQHDCVPSARQRSQGSRMPAPPRMRLEPERIETPESAKGQVRVKAYLFTWVSFCWSLALRPAPAARSSTGAGDEIPEAPRSREPIAPEPAVNSASPRAPKLGSFQTWQAKKVTEDLQVRDQAGAAQMHGRMTCCSSSCAHGQAVGDGDSHEAGEQGRDSQRTPANSHV